MHRYDRPLTVFVASPDTRAEQALGVLRLAGPLRRAGVRQVWWNEATLIEEQVPQVDLVVIQRNFPERRQACARIVTAARLAGKPVVFEIDDLLWELPGEHPDRQNKIYADAFFPMIQVAADADAITVASPALQAYCSRFHPNVWLLPNYLDQDLWTLRTPKPFQAGQPVSIGYMGGSSHLPDLESIAPVLVDLCQQYGSSLLLIFWGVQPPSSLLSLPNTRWIPTDITRYVDFAAYFSQQECDLWIAPLRPSRFNECKSAIKFLEYTATGAPGVFSRVATYEQAVEHGVTGLLAGSLGEWQACLTRLIEASQTRQEIAIRAQESVKQNWLLSDHASEWEQAYRQIVGSNAGIALDPARAAYPHPIPAALASNLAKHWADQFAAQANVNASEQSSVVTQSIKPNPKASIILVTYNNLNLTRQCLDSIYARTSDPNFEVIVVDNASQDDTPRTLLEYAAAYPNLKVVLNPVNAGFARGNNIGTAAASGEYLVFLNNDTVVTHGWLAGLLCHLQDPAVGMVGPVTNYSSNESRIAVEYDPVSPGLEGMEAFAEAYTRRHAGQAFEVEMLLLLCVALRRAVYDQVGGIDERYGIGLFEDEDFSKELRQKSYKLLCAEDVYIHHWGSASFSKLGLAGYWLTHEENRNKFETKWNQRWYPQLYRSELQREHIRQLVDGSLWLAKQVIEAEKENAALTAQVKERDQKLMENWEMVLDRDRTLAAIYRSRGWRLLQLLWRVRLRLIPHHSHRERIASLVVHAYRVLRHDGLSAFFRKSVGKVLRSRLVRRGLGWMIPQRVKAFYHTYREEYPLVDRTQVILYADPAILPDYSPRRALDLPAIERSPVEVTLISTVRNEAAHAKSWLDSLLQQSRLPDEMIVTDGGSTDDTVAIIREFARSAPFPIQVIEAGRVNVSSGRNIAIQNASYPIIACSDFGCILDKDWLHNLILPFEVDEETQLSAGFYDPLPGTDFQNLAGSFFTPGLNTVEPQYFLPSGRSVAMRKSLWARAGGYPEYLTLSGEDTLFDYQAKLQGGVWAFVPQAKVSWRVVHNFERLADAWFRYARGDGEVGLLAPAYWSKTKQIGWFFCVLIFDMLVSVIAALFFPPWGWLVPGCILLWTGLILTRSVHRNMRSHGLNLRLALLRMNMDSVISYYQFKGFLAGVRNRPRIKQRQIQIYAEQLRKIVADHPDRKGIIVFPPTHDWGFMFQRPHQMARALARRGYLFFFHVYNLKTDAVVGFQQVEPGLYICYVPMEAFHVLHEPVVYIGSPWHRGTLKYFDHPVIVYDHYDDLAVWNARQEDHQYLLQNAKVVLVTARGLLQKAKITRPDSLFAPNAVDFDFIQKFRPGENPDDIPEDLKSILGLGKPVIGYSGAIAEWFDYDLMREVVRACPDWEFVFIGVNYDQSLIRSGILESGLENLHWLGMKPYDELFRYVWRFDVGIIPFKVNNITLATSPIKLFEYMACAKPVVSTPLPECKEYPGVFIAETTGQFIDRLRLALHAGTDEVYLRTIDQVARQNTWAHRAEAIIARLEEVITAKNIED
jgi:GT2 family glycosyltransferase/glycosyltransferase involved in cell wall biosynthesis